MAIYGFSSPPASIFPWQAASGSFCHHTLPWTRQKKQSRQGTEVSLFAKMQKLHTIITMQLIHGLHFPDPSIDERIFLWAWYSVFPKARSPQIFAQLGGVENPAPRRARAKRQAPAMAPRVQLPSGPAPAAPGGSPMATRMSPVAKTPLSNMAKLFQRWGKVGDLGGKLEGLGRLVRSIRWGFVALFLLFWLY